MFVKIPLSKKVSTSCKIVCESSKVVVVTYRLQNSNRLINNYTMLTLDL